MIKIKEINNMSDDKLLRDLKTEFEKIVEEIKKRWGDKKTTGRKASACPFGCRSKRCLYNALEKNGDPEGYRIFIQKLLRRHINSNSQKGFEKLKEINGLYDLSFESLVISERFSSLFTNADQKEASLRLNNDQEISSLDLTETTEKKLRQHLCDEGRISRNLIDIIKSELGYTCEVCGNFDFEKHYGALGKNFIELHHLYHRGRRTNGEIVEIHGDLKAHFAVLCSNCHKMIHKLTNPKLNREDVETLKSLYK